MARTVSLKSLGAEVKLGWKGVTFNIKGDNDPERNGRLRIGGAKVSWTRAGTVIPKEKTLNQLIDFLKSE